MARLLPFYASIASLSFAWAQRNEDPASSQSISWEPCPDSLASQYANAPLPYDCANITVPLDYTNDGSDPLVLSLVRVPAIRQPARGSVLYNPGGPGVPGIPRLVLGSAGIQPLTGGIYDVISWNPRGTSGTIPFDCPGNPAVGYTSEPGTGNNLTEFFYNGGWNRSVSYAEGCLEPNRATGDKVGTTFTARDMLSIINALGQNELNYFGQSYGTFLGATFASMFPDKVGKFVLDGVVNPLDWISAHRITQVEDMDRAFDFFLSECAANPTKCKLIDLFQEGENVTGPDIRSLFETRLADSIKPPASQEARSNYVRTKNLVRSALYKATGWTDITETLYTILAEGYIIQDPPNEPESGDGLFGIACADAPSRTDDPDFLRPLLDEQQRQGYFADAFFASAGWYCSAWPFKGPEQFQGPFSAKTANPIMLIGSPYDPTTPIESAYNVSAGFEGSVVLKHNGAGHTSTNSYSNCTIKFMNAYFVNGTLPPPDSECEANDRPFDKEPLKSDRGENSGDALVGGNQTGSGGNQTGSGGGQQSGAPAFHASSTTQVALWIAALVASFMLLQ